MLESCTQHQIYEGRHVSLPVAISATVVNGTRPESLSVASSSNADSVSHPLRILLASASSGSQGGGELYLVGLAQQFRRLGHTVDVLLSEHSAWIGCLTSWAMCTGSPNNVFEYV